MEKSIENINEKGSDQNPSTFSNQNAHSNAIQDSNVSRVVRQQGSLVGEEQTTADHQHPYCQIQGMLDDARVMLWQAGKAKIQAGPRQLTLKTTVNYIKRIRTLLPYFPVPGGDGRKWYHVRSPHGERCISLADVSICLSEVLVAISGGDNNAATGLIEKSQQILADLIEADRQIVGGSSK